MGILKQMLSKYEITNEEDVINALKEIFQEIILLGLYRGNFFKKATFYGGTALRILHGLNRFSEDMDFSLLEKNTSFNIEPYFGNIIDEFEALGIKVNLSKKVKTNTQSIIESAFLKNDTLIHDISIGSKHLDEITGGVYKGRKIKIKLEVDTNPPLSFKTEAKTLLLPVTFNVITMTLPNLYAGKMHAVLFRNWKTRVKGRDWFDFEWYVKQGIYLNLDHLKERMVESGDFDSREHLTVDYFKEIINKKIKTLDFNKAKSEVRPFIRDKSVLDF